MQKALAIKIGKLYVSAIKSAKLHKTPAIEEALILRFVANGKVRSNNSDLARDRVGRPRSVILKGASHEIWDCREVLPKTMEPAIVAKL